MKYAHIGNSKDNAMTLDIDGKPTRKFVAFANAQDRKQFQEDTWNKTAGAQNVIPCTRKEVEKYFGKDFVITANGIMSRADYEAHQLREG